MAAQLTRTLIKQYQVAERWSTHFRFKRPAGSCDK
jgi:hypothetical protein